MATATETESVKKPSRTRGLKRGGSPGRPKGVPNKATLAVRELAGRFVGDAEYQRKLLARLRSGKLAPAVETMLWHYVHGKPKETHQVELPQLKEIVGALLGVKPEELPE